MKKPELIVALDVDTAQKAMALVNTLTPAVKLFKVGLQLFTCAGPQMVDYINSKGAGVFLDLKFYDIPNTVAQAVRQAVRLNVNMLTLHISGSEEMVRQAVKAADDAQAKTALKRPLLLGVTVLTSSEASPEAVVKMAGAGIGWGLDGVVCSAREAAQVRCQVAGDYVIVTPGIRSEDAEAQDQKRTATAVEAVKAGSNFLVVGRPVIASGDPLAAAKKIIEDIDRAKKD